MFAFKRGEKSLLRVHVDPFSEGRKDGFAELPSPSPESVLLLTLVMLNKLRCHAHF